MFYTGFTILAAAESVPSHLGDISQSCPYGFTVWRRLKKHLSLVLLSCIWHPLAVISTLIQQTQCTSCSYSAVRFINLIVEHSILCFSLCNFSSYHGCDKINDLFDSVSHRYAGGQCYLEKQDICGYPVGLHTAWLGSPQVRSRDILFPFFF